ncbi:T9SS type A sorting domain-containing protein [bacterium]|nr:T9SS type A sorting domain-containing protein [bacterium]
MVVNVLPLPIVDAGPDKSITPGGSVQIGGSPTASGSTGPFTFSWSPATGLSDATIANPVASPTNSTTYVVTVTGANNCSATDTVTVIVAGLNKPFLFLATEFIQSKKHKLIEGNIHSNNDITIKKGKKSEIVGDLFAVDDIEISKKNDVIGNVTAGSEVDNDGDVSGVISEGALVGFVPLPVIPPFTVGTTSIEVPKKATLSLAPGPYDNVEIEKGGILELSSGIYSMKSLEMSKKTKLCIDVSGGAVTINISDDLVFGKSSEVIIKPNGEVDSKLVTFNFIDDDDDNGDDDYVKIGKKSKVLGTIVAPDAWVILESKSSFKGAICAENIVVKSKVAALHHDAATSLAKLAPEDLDDEDEDVIPAASIPTEFGLHQNFPNPFNPSTTIAFGMPKAGNVTLSIFNMRGQLVRTLVSDPMGAGNHKVVWDGNDRNGLRVASGVYVYRLEVRNPAAGSGLNFVATKKLVLTK